MIVYFFIFVIPILLHLSQKDTVKKNFIDYLLLTLIASILIGFRHYTGGDWGNYYRNFNFTGSHDYLSLFTNNTQNLIEFSNLTLFWILYYLEPSYGYYLYHFTAILFGLFALYLFAKEQPYFWLTIGIAVPFFIIIMIMGYTRQGIALSLIMIGLYYLKRYQLIQFGLSVVIATTFHASAIVMSLLALPYIFHKKFHYKHILFTTIFIIGLFSIELLQQYFEKKELHYIQEAMSSAGALPRLLITLLSGIFFLQYSKRWQLAFNDHLIWRSYAFAAFATIPALAFFPSTSVDRIALYLLPLQLATWPRIIYLSRPENRQILTFGIISGYALTLYVWLHYADNVYMWLPFKHLFFN